MGCAGISFQSPQGARQVALVVAANLAVNILFFITHPVVTPYYTVPIAMLSFVDPFVYHPRAARGGRG